MNGARAIVAWGAMCIASWGVPGARAHDHSRPQAEQRQLAAAQRAAALAEDPPSPGAQATCRLTLRLRDAARNEPLPGLVRLTNLATGKAIPLPDEIHRELNWYSVGDEVPVVVPQVRVRIEAVHGIETELARRDVDLSGKPELAVDLALRRFYDPRQENLRSGNTHLHLMKLTYLEAIRYLQRVPRSDGLDLVFLSHLRRMPDERDYISNRIVENSFTGGELQRLSQHGVLFANGEEHRHNFGRGGEGYGHVMLLDLLKLIQPVSIGPGIMGQGTDGRPLQTGIREARADGATIIWCHNKFGFEDVPNWLAGVLHAQNIFDGGEHGSYRDTYYKYLNLGLRTPFSTGTDWFIYDFSRVYVPLSGELTSRNWLAAVQAGRTYITNGTFLEFSVDERPVGDTISLPGPGQLMVRGRAIGRNDFRGIEIVHDGEVVQSSPSRAEEEHFTARMEVSVSVKQSGWLALRVPLESGRNELDKLLFAHTSPIYVDIAGGPIFRPEVARQLIAEMEQNMTAISQQGKFANDAERESVLQVHREGIRLLRQRLDKPQ
jgi:hypothetical protein